MAANVRLRRSLDLALCAAFVAGLLACWLDFALRPAGARSPAHELREPAEPPARIGGLATLLAFPASAERWWNDWFGLRDVLIGARNQLLWQVFELSPTDRMVRGRDGWLFYQGDDEVLQVDRGARPFSAEQLAAWTRVFEARRAWCDARGIQLVVAIVPSKACVYPERLPRGFERIGPSRAAEVRAALGPRWDGVWLDLEALTARERELDTPDDPSFAPFGTHWTDRTAFAAYRAIVEAVARQRTGGAPRSAADFERAPDPTGGDSWAARLYLDGVLEQRVQRWTPASPRAVASPPLERSVRDATFTCPDAPWERAYVLHDSFGPEVRAWLAEHFRETSTHWQYDFEGRTIAAFAPEVLVMLFSDRYFVLVEPALAAEPPARR
ncbi:MAG: hypothetical protein HZA52_19770 [Planctomycetes bacterium]|nr:hypothetical protein [Planctomycetota bacterium]